MWLKWNDQANLLLQVLGQQPLEVQEVVACVVPTKNIHEAVAKNKRGSVVRHINLGAEIDEVNDDGLTAMQSAVLKGQFVISKDLVGLGANVNLVDEVGKVPLHYAARDCMDGDAASLDLVIALLERRAKVDATDKASLTPLQAAAEQGRLDAALLLLKARANVNHRSDNTYTPFGIAQDMAGQQMQDLLASWGGER